MYLSSEYITQEGK